MLWKFWKTWSLSMKAWFTNMRFCSEARPLNQSQTIMRYISVIVMSRWTWELFKNEQLVCCTHEKCKMSFILYLVWCILQVPSLKSTALIFLEISYILWVVFLWNHWWRHQFFNKNLNISRMISNISKTRAPFFFCSEGLPNKLHLFFTS